MAITHVAKMKKGHSVGVMSGDNEGEITQRQIDPLLSESDSERKQWWTCRIRKEAIYTLLDQSHCQQAMTVPCITGLFCLEKRKLNTASRTWPYS